MATPVYSNMNPSAFDAMQPLLVKATYWAQSISENNGGVPGTAIYDNMNPSPTDTPQVLLAKLTYWLAAISAGLP